MKNNTCYWCDDTEKLLNIDTMPQLCYDCDGMLVCILTECVEILENRSVFINKDV